MPYNSGLDHCPEGLQDYIERADACSYFMSEEPYDEERTAFLNEMLVENKCNYLACDFDALFAKFEGDISYIRVLTEITASTFGESSDLPVCEEQAVAE